VPCAVAPVVVVVLADAQGLPWLVFPLVVPPAALVAVPGFLWGQVFLGGRFCSMAATSAIVVGTATSVAVGGAFRCSSSTRLASSRTGEVSSMSWRWIHSGRREKYCHGNHSSGSSA